MLGLSLRMKKMGGKSSSTYFSQNIIDISLEHRH